jgi:hypothetical protein
MIEPTIWMQLGISDDRYIIISREITTITNTKEKVGILMEMVKDSTTMTSDEKLYAAFIISKYYIERKLFSSMPFFGREILEELLET